MKAAEAMFGILFQAMGQFFEGLITLFAAFGPTMVIPGQALGLEVGAVP